MQWSFIMLKKIILITIFFLCFIFIYSENNLFDSDNPFGLDGAKIETIKKLYETEGLVSDWFKGCMQDFVKYAKAYDKEKIKSKETMIQLENTTIKILMFALLSTLVIPSFNDKELTEYAETSGLTKELDGLSEETTGYLDKLGSEAMSNLGIGVGEVNSEMLNQYIDITINSINEYLNSKNKVK